MTRRKLWFALVLALPVALVALVARWSSHNELPPPRDEAPRRLAAPIDAGSDASAHDAVAAALDAPSDDGPVEVDAPDLDASDVVAADAAEEDVALDDANADDANADDANADDASADDASAGEGFELTIDGIMPADRCMLRVAARGVVATCDSRALTCTALTRGELSPDPGEELVSRCDHAGGPVFLVLSSADAVLWANRTDQSSELPGETCGDLPELTAEAITVAGQAQRALLVRARGCSEPANYVDWDEVYWWNEGALASVASASFACIYEGATDGPEMNERGTYDCHGGYLTRGPRTPDTTFTVVGCETCSQRDLGAGRLMQRRGRVLQTLVWNGESQRFESP